MLNTKAQTHNGSVCLGPKPQSTCTWMNDHVAAASVAFVHAQAGAPQPFFLYVAATTPHIGHLGSAVGDNGGAWPTPLVYRHQLPANWTALEAKDHPDTQFAAAVIAQDDIVGRVLDAIAAAGIEDRTVVFFAGDNGPDDHSFRVFDDPGGFRGKKRSLHEGGIRQTVAVQWVGVIKPASESRALFSFVDFLPTALDIAGVPVTRWPPTDGVSALPALIAAGSGGSGSLIANRFLYWEFCGYANYSGLLPQLYPVGWAQAVRLDDNGTEWKGTVAVSTPTFFFFFFFVFVFVFFFFFLVGWFWPTRFSVPLGDIVAGVCVHCECLDAEDGACNPTSCPLHVFKLTVGIRVDSQPLMLWNLTADDTESSLLGPAAHADVRSKIVGIMQREHVESAQWPSNTNPQQVCCGSCFSKHGCTGTGRNCPAPIAAATSAATDTAPPPALAPEDLHGDWFD